MATFRRILCRPYVSFALIANQALNIFCLNFFKKKNHRQPKNSLRIFTVIDDLTDRICLFASDDLTCRILKGFTQALSQPDLSIPTNDSYSVTFLLSGTTNVLDIMILGKNLFHHFCPAARASVSV